MTQENIDTSMDKDTPRDVRLLHLLLASQAIHQYEDKVPLQLMDFAYRYTRGVLKDAMVYNEYKEHNLVEDSNADESTDNSSNNNNNNSNNSNNSSNAPGQLSVEDIRLAIASRTQYQFKPTAPKELMLKLASDRNKKSLPQVMGSWGVRLPPEKYCINAKEWTINPQSKPT
ncbi:transcription initiation factor TFIID subunit 9 [Monosporozyma servazzii]